MLLRELGEPYAKFLTGVIDEKCHLASLEQDTLGFDHNQLSAALLVAMAIAGAAGRGDCGAEEGCPAVADDAAGGRLAADFASR